MIFFLLQALLLIAIAFLLGAIVGCLFRRMSGSAESVASNAASASATPAASHGGASSAAATVATAAATAVAARTVAPQPAAPSARAVPAAEPVAFDRAPARSAAPASEPVKLVSSSGASSKPAAKAKAPAAPKAAAKPKPAPKKPVKAKVAAAAAGVPDDLKLIVGIGPKNEKALNAQGVNSFAQIASWSVKDQAAWGDKLEFPGRVEREEWVAQAKRLAKGEKPATVGKTASKAPAKSGGSGKAQTLKGAGRGKPDNLTLINGIGNALEKKLNSLGVYRFDQIASWSDKDADRFSMEVGFPGRVKRENWIGEAKTFAKGGTTAHARRVEKGVVPTSRQTSKPKGK